MFSKASSEKYATREEKLKMIIDLSFFFFGKLFSNINNGHILFDSFTTRSDLFSRISIYHFQIPFLPCLSDIHRAAPPPHIWKASKTVILGFLLLTSRFREVSLIPGIRYCTSVK